VFDNVVFVFQRSHVLILKILCWFSAPVTNSVKPRWQRKKEKAAAKVSASLNESLSNVNNSVNGSFSVNQTPRKRNSSHVATPRSKKRARPSSKSSMKKKGSKTPCYDRFIPNRSATNVDIGNFRLNGESNDENAKRESPNTQGYKKNLKEHLLGEDGSESTKPDRASRILAFKNKAPAAPEEYQKKTVFYTL
jgi:hypothetical protein